MANIENMKLKTSGVKQALYYVVPSQSNSYHHRLQKSR